MQNRPNVSRTLESSRENHSHRMLWVGRDLLHLRGHVAIDAVRLGYRFAGR